MSTYPSQQLLKWVSTQAAFGVGREALRSWALGGGFAHAEVERSIEAVAREGGFDPKGSRPSLMAERGAWRLAPGVECRMWMTCPEIALFDGVVSSSDAQEIRDQAAVGLRASLVAGLTPSVSGGRASRSRTFLPGECLQADALRGFIGALVGVDSSHLEPLQVTLYEEGGFYAPHHDYFPRGHQRADGPTQRVGTVVVYLSEPDCGGQTVVEPVGLRIAPKAGSALFFAYPDEGSRELCLHASAPCSGGKWVATQWITRGVAPGAMRQLIDH